MNLDQKIDIGAFEQAAGAPQDCKFGLSRLCGAISRRVPAHSPSSEPFLTISVSEALFDPEKRRSRGMPKPAAHPPMKPLRSPRLTEKSVAEIRSLHARTDAGWTPKSLARIFGVTETAISAVLNRTGAYKDQK